MAGTSSEPIVLNKQQQYLGLRYLRAARACPTPPAPHSRDSADRTRPRKPALYNEGYDGVLRRPTWTAIGALIGLRPDMCYSNTSSVLRPALVAALYAPSRARAVFRKAKELQPTFFADCGHLCEQSTEFANRLAEKTNKRSGTATARSELPSKGPADNDVNEDDDDLDDMLVDMIEDAMTNDFDWNEA